MKEIQETWENLKFNVNRYIKGTSDRGFILGPTDEIAVIVDDNAMNLQSMSASRSGCLIADSILAQWLRLPPSSMTML